MHYKVLTYQDWNQFGYRGYAINLGKGKEGYSDSYMDIMDKIIDDVEFMRAQYKCLYIVRFELCFSSNDSARLDKASQGAISELCKRVKCYLEKEVSNPRNEAQRPLRNHKNVHVAWVREYGKNKKYHYHCYMCLDGSKIKSFGSREGEDIVSLFTLIQHYWLKACGVGFDCPEHLRPYVHVNRGNRPSGHLIRNNSADGGEGKFRAAIWHLSYLAKVRDKQRNKNSCIRLASHSLPVKR